MPAYCTAELPYAVSPDDLTLPLNMTLLTMTQTHAESLQDVGTDLARRMLRQFGEHPYLTFSERAELLAGRQFTLTRTRRALLHTVLDLKESPNLPAVRILGFRRAASGTLLRSLQDSSGIPLVTKLADADQAYFADDIAAAHFYHQLVWQRTGITLKDEYRQPLIIR